MQYWIYVKEINRSAPHLKPLHLQTVFESYRYFGGTVAEDLFNQGLCLPSGSNLSTSERDRVISLIPNASQSNKP